MSKAHRYESFCRLDTGTHTQAIHQIAVSPNGEYLITAAETTLRVWDLETHKPLRMLLGEVTDPAALLEGSGNIKRFALSHDGRWVVALRSRIKPSRKATRAQRYTQVQVFELLTGDLRAGFDYPGLLFDLSFSHDDRYLAMAAQPPEFDPDESPQRGLVKGVIQIYATHSMPQQLFKHMPKPVATLEVTSANCESLPPSAVRFLPVPRTDSSDYRLIWAGRQPHPDAQHGGDLAWLGFSMDDGLHELSRIATELIINPATLAVGREFSVIAPYINNRTPTPDRQFLCFDHHGKPLASVPTEARPASLAFTAAGNQLLVGMAAENEPGVSVVRACVYAVARKKFELRSTYYGHDDSVAASTFLSDGTAISTGGDNHALHVWRPEHSEGEFLAVMRGVGRELHRVGINEEEQIGFDSVPERLRASPEAGVQRIFDLRSMRLRARLPDETGNFDLFSSKWQVLAGSQTIGLRPRISSAEAGQAITFSSGYQEEVEVWTPELTLFVGADDEWVIWSRSGYYDASPNGAHHFGFHINRGADREALYFPSDRFSTFYRPDIIRAVITHGSEDQARAEGLEIAPVDVVSVLPPVVEMAKGGVQEGQDEVSFSFTVRSLRKGSPVTRVWILQNEQFAWTAPDIKASYVVTLKLRPGRNAFAIMAESADAKAIPLVHVTTGSAQAGSILEPTAGSGKDARDSKPGNLYLLCVGVSDFEVAGTDQARGFKPLKFAHRDAIAIRNALSTGTYDAEPVPAAEPAVRGQGANAGKKAKRGNLAFQAVDATVLLNQSATKAAIFSEVNRLCALVNQRNETHRTHRDVLFVFLSGHGVRFKGDPDLYFWNHDLHPDNMSLTGLSLIELGGLVTSVPAEVVLAIDACHSGSAGADVMRGLDPDELAKRIHAVNERGMYILNAARSEELAHEHEDMGHGFFTKAILDTLRLENSLLTEQQQSRHRTVSMLGLIAGVQELVPYYTEQKQSSLCRTYGDLLELVIFKR